MRAGMSRQTDRQTDIGIHTAVSLVYASRWISVYASRWISCAGVPRQTAYTA